MGFSSTLIKELGIARKYLDYRLRLGFSKYITSIQPQATPNSAFMRNLHAFRSQRAAAKHKAHQAMTWKEWALHHYQSSFSTQAAKMALLESCATAHAAEVAADMGIDVSSIRFVEAGQRAAGLKEGHRQTGVTALIEAPNASDEELAVFVQRIQRECPVAAQMGDSIQYKRTGGPD